MLVWSVVSKLIIGLLSLLVVVRVLGKKSLSALTPFDFVYTLVLGGILEESLYDDQVSVWHLLLGVALWGLLIYFTEKVAYKNDRFNKILKGEPAVFIFDGELILQELEENKVEMEQLRGLLRQQGCFSLENAKHAIMETGGQISVVQKDDEDKTVSLLVVDEGHLEEDTIDNHGIEKNWVIKELSRLGYSRVGDIFYAEWSKEKGFYVILYKDIRQQKVRLDG